MLSAEYGQWPTVIMHTAPRPQSKTWSVVTHFTELLAISSKDLVLLCFGLLALVFSLVSLLVREQVSVKTTGFRRPRAL
jgi:hypothetical protein